MKYTNTIKKISTVIAASAAALLIASCGKVKEEQFGIGSPTSSSYTDDDLVWVENFDQKKLDTDNWMYEVHYPGWVNNELQSYVVSDDNIYLKDGKLIIQPLKIGNTYTSGRINTLGKKEFTYGRFEARLKVPRGKGFLPAFWMMPADESLYGQWPKCGEIDIMEVLGDNVNKVYGSLHFGEPHTQKQGSAQELKGNFADDFHIFAVEWEPDEMRFYVDDRCYYKTSEWFTKRSGFGEVSYPAPYDQPFYMILNVAVGGNWPGNPDEYTTFDEQAQMVVDYVKVYQKKEYNSDVKKPEAAVSKMQVKEGNIASNLGSRWMLHLEPDGKATADLTDNGLTVRTTEQGNADYSVQLVQSYIQMVQGETYKYTFDAWADEPRTIKTAVTLPNNSWKRSFGDVRVALDTRKKTYTYTFTNEEVSDENARLEFQLGATDSTATVYIQNIKLEHVKNVGPVNKHPALPDGNLIYNGQFQEGEKRMGNWTVEAMDGAKVYATNEKKVRQLKAEVPANCDSADKVKVIQKGIKLTPLSENTVKLEAASTVPGKIQIKCGNAVNEIELTSSMEKYEINFIAPKDNKEVSFEMLLGIPGSVVTVDNVSLKENILVQNGNFDKKMISYEVYAHSDAVEEHEVDEGQADKFCAVTIDKTGNQDWMIQLMQRNIDLEEGKTYKLTFKAKCDIKRDIMMALQRDGLQDNDWTPYSGQPTFAVSNEWKTYEHEFTMAHTSDSKVILTFSMGAVNQTPINRRHTVCFDDISLVEVK
ncbi:carbohydrate binding domain-containing protein [Treponema sp.]|uniref:carbohydrate binding domain-containing protein n=1 Tax=Treponema sp. TaxID=166 RepID=UPI00298ED0A1|nr:carbohydrate binding domain-containing protein [Treponema sp.]